MSRKKVKISDLNLKKIGGRIAFLRVRSGLSQAKLSELTGISRGNLSGLESHKYEPSLSATIKILDHFNVDPVWLLKGEGEQPVPLPSDFLELLEMTKCVLKSETHYAESLSANIRSFHDAVQSKEESDTIKRQLEDLKRRVDRINGGGDGDNNRPPGAVGGVTKKTVK